MADIKSDSEMLAEIYRNTHYALQSISDVLPETEDEKMKELLKKMHDEYELISGKAALLAKEKDLELKEPNPLKKAMMWSSIKMSTFKDNSRGHIAEMMTQGTVMGTTALLRSLNDSKDNLSDEVRSLCKELLHMEESYEEQFKKYL